jgi:hypothetical protein
VAQIGLFKFRVFDSGSPPYVCHLNFFPSDSSLDLGVRGLTMAFVGVPLMCFACSDNQIKACKA